MDKIIEIDNRVEKLKKLLEEKGAEDIIIKRTIENTKLIRYANNDITISTANEEILLLIKFGYKNRVLTTFTNNPEFVPEEEVNKLIKIASSIKEEETYAKLPIQKFEYPPLVYIDEETKSLEEKAVNYVENAINKSLEFGINKVAGIFKIDLEKIRLITSTGIDIEDERSIVMLSHRCIMDKDATGQWACCAKEIKDLDIETTVLKASELAKASVNPKKIESGNYDIIFSPMIFADLIETVSGLSSAKAVELGISFLANKINQNIAPEFFYLIDDPTDANKAGFARFDDEGIPTRRKEIISKGILKVYLHNLTTAKKFNTETTGNAGITFPEPFNVIVKGGDYNEEEIFKEVRKGLFIVNNWYLRFQNYLTGDFSTVLRDGVFLIDNGEIKMPLIGGRLSENFLNLLNSIVGLTKKIYAIKWWEVEKPTYVPYALAKNLRITTAE